MRATAARLFAGGLGLMLLAVGCGEGTAGNQRQLSREGGVTDPTTLSGAGADSQPGQADEGGPTLPVVRDLAIDRGYGLALVPDALVVLDLADPAAPAVGKRLVLSRTPVDLAVDSLHAFVACDSGGLQVVSLAKPREPEIVGSYSPTNGGVNLVAAADGVALVSIPGAGVAVLDVTDPGRPGERKLLPGRGDVRELAINDDRGYLLTKDLVIVDLSKPEAAEVTATQESRQLPLGLGFYLERTIVADAGGFRLLNLAAPENPLTLGQLTRAELTAALPEKPATAPEQTSTPADVAVPEQPAATEQPTEPAPDTVAETPAEPAVAKPEPVVGPRLAVADGYVYFTDGETVAALTIEGNRKLVPLARLTDLGRVSALAATGQILLVGTAGGEVIVFRWSDGELKRTGSLALEAAPSPAAGAAPEPAGLNPPPLPTGPLADAPVLQPGDRGDEPTLP